MDPGARTASMPRAPSSCLGVLVVKKRRLSDPPSSGRFAGAGDALDEGGEAVPPDLALDDAATLHPVELDRAARASRGEMAVPRSLADAEGEHVAAIGLDLGGEVVERDG